MEIDMIFALLFFMFCIAYGISKAGKGLVEYLEQKEYDRKRFYLLVQAELDRLEKMTEETKQVERRSRNPSAWEMRN